MIRQTEPGRIRDEDEIYLVDIIRFLHRNAKFLLLTTLGLSAIAIPLFLLQPKQYQKQLTLSVKPFPVPVPTFPVMDVHQSGTLAVGFLQNSSELKQILDKPTYDPVTQQINLTARSLDTSGLSDVSPKVQSRLKKGFEEIMGRSLKTSLSSTEIEIKKNQRVLEQLKQQSGQFSPTNQFRLGSVETYRVVPVAKIAELEVEKQYLEQAQQNLAEFTSQFISIQILAESEVPQTRSLLPLMVISIIASFVAAVFASIIREQIARLQDELSETKLDSSQKV